MKIQLPDAAATSPLGEHETAATRNGSWNTWRKMGPIVDSCSERGEGRWEMTRRDDAPYTTHAYPPSSGIQSKVDPVGERLGSEGIMSDLMSGRGRSSAGTGSRIVIWVNGGGGQPELTQAVMERRELSPVIQEIAIRSSIHFPRRRRKQEAFPPPSDCDSLNIRYKRLDFYLYQHSILLCAHFSFLFSWFSAILFLLCFFWGPFHWFWLNLGSNGVESAHKLFKIGSKDVEI